MYNIMINKYNYKNIHEIIKLKKMVITAKFNENIYNNKLFYEYILQQKSLYLLARKNVVYFNQRKGQIIGCKITIRRDKLWQLLYYLNIYGNKILPEGLLNSQRVNNTGILTIGYNKLLNHKIALGLPYNIKGDHGCLINMNFNTTHIQQISLFLSSFKF